MNLTFEDKLNLVCNNGDLCSVCKYNSVCEQHGVTGGPNGPVYPYCADHDDYIDEDELDRYVEDWRDSL